MSRIIWNSFWLAPALLGASAFSAFAQTSTVQPPASQDSVMNQVSAYSSEGQSAATLGQVTSVSQLTDVRPTDWAFQALQSLVERYGCIVGYPDKTYRGNRALTRFEFAAGLNACLDKIQELIAAATADFVKKEDLETVKKLQEEFATELAALRGRVESLEVRTATLEKQQFSTTTKLSGEVIFAVADTFGDAATVDGIGRRLTVNVPAPTAANPNATNAVPSPRGDNTNTIFADRVRLKLNTSFTGKDLLVIRLAASNITPFSGNNLTGTNSTLIGVSGCTGAGSPSACDNSVRVDKLYYRFALGKLRLQVDAINAEAYDGFFSPLSGPFSSNAEGSISRFGRFNPMVARAGNPSGTAGGSAGGSLRYTFNDFVRFEAAYISDNQSNDPTLTKNPLARNGLFSGSYAAIGQIVLTPIKGLDVGLNYVRGYQPAGDINFTSSTGSTFAARPFGNGTTSGFSSDTFGISTQWAVTKNVTVGGWYSYSTAYRKVNADYANIQTWNGFIAISDIGGKGNVLGLSGGQLPRLNDTRFRINNGAGLRQVDRDAAYEAQLFYKYRLSDNISITPGVFVIFNPEGNSRNDTQYVGVLRTVFTF
ncbi:MAG: hypothetical protein DCF22_06845 [Leptolyngbya sp.]|nr:MAG: hypothetical protein DCF22_06845 [Leptolyngbya sp.]